MSFVWGAENVALKTVLILYKPIPFLKEMTYSTDFSKKRVDAISNGR
jgi:hypothetical protein